MAASMTCAALAFATTRQSYTVLRKLRNEERPKQLTSAVTLSLERSIHCDGRYANGSVRLSRNCLNLLPEAFLSFFEA